jgi:hypothetical protein
MERSRHDGMGRSKEVGKKTNERTCEMNPSTDESINLNDESAMSCRTPVWPFDSIRASFEDPTQSVELQFGLSPLHRHRHLRVLFRHQ